MKVIELCGSEHCTVVKIEDDRVEIGEDGNLCVLSKLLLLTKPSNMFYFTGDGRNRRSKDFS